jgi:signal transduction histidine kinase
LGWKDVLISRIGTSEQDLGVFVVDRLWDDIGLIQADEEILESYSRHAAQVLLRHQALHESLLDIQHEAKALIHEIREPLNKLQSASERIDRGGTLEKLAKAGKDLHDAFEYLMQNIKQLEAVFASDRPFDSVPIDDVLNMAKESERDESERNPSQARLECFLESTGVTVKINPDAIRLALKNLIRNAQSQLKSTTEARIWVRVAAIDGSVAISVEDNGPGVDEATLRRLCRMVPRILHGQVVGFGLFLVRWIAHKHGGDLELASTKGKGFTATLKLPLVRE